MLGSITNNSPINELIPPITIFLPVYNEEKSIQIILRNFKLVLQVFPDAQFIVSDNCSTDLTVKSFSFFPEQFIGRIKIWKSSQNFGFSANIAKVANVPGNGLVMLLGADDLLLFSGLSALRNLIRSRPDVDMIISNWAYSKSIGSVHSLGDCGHHFEANSLDEFFQHQTWLPNGISQIVARKSLFGKIELYIDKMSPHLGVFLDAFPCTMVCLGNPPLAMGAHVVVDGWRSSAASILMTHVRLTEEMLEHLLRCYRSEAISKKTFYQIRGAYLSIIPASVKVAKTEKWGSWEGSYQKKCYFLAGVMLHFFFLRLRFFFLRLYYHVRDR